MRWEMEAWREFTIEGYIEIAWIMGFIKHFDSQLKDGSLYVGWVQLDSKLMNLLTTRRSKVGMRRISCFMLASVLSVSATGLIYPFNPTLPFRT